MKKSIEKNYIYNLTYQILIMILPFITTPYVSRALGANNIGIYSYTLSITTFFILFGSLGIALYGQRETAYAQDNREKVSYIFWEVVILRSMTMLISIIIYYLTFVTGNNEYKMYYGVLLIELFGNMLDISWFFQGLEEFKKTVVRNIIVKIISLILIFVFIKEENDLTLYFIIYVMSTLVGNLSLWLYLPKCIHRIKLNKLRIFRHLLPTAVLFIPQVAIQVYTLLDKTMIGAIINNKAEVGYYEQAQKIIKMLMTIITSLGTVMLPRIASIYACGDENKIKEYMNKSFNMVFFMGMPLILGLIAIVDDFVPVFFGDGFEKVSIIIKVISPIIILIGLSNVIGVQYLLPTKKQKQYTISVICGAFINFFINILLIGRFGAIGASIGTVLAEFTVTAVQVFYTRKKFDWKIIAKLSINYLIASVLMYISCRLVGAFNISRIATIALQVICGTIVYVILLLLFKDRFLTEIINKVLKKIIKGRKINSDEI